MKERWKNPGFINCIVYTHRGPISHVKGATGQVLLTENVMNQAQNLQGIALSNLP